MKLVIKILAVLIFFALVVGFYFRWQDQIALGDKIIGIAVLTSAFILMPIFLYVSWKGKKFEDYTLTQKNIDKMKEGEKD